MCNSHSRCGGNYGHAHAFAFALHGVAPIMCVGIWLVTWYQWYEPDTATHHSLLPLYQPDEVLCMQICYCWQSCGRNVPVFIAFQLCIGVLNGSTSNSINSKKWGAKRTENGMARRGRGTQMCLNRVFVSPLIHAIDTFVPFTVQEMWCVWNATTPPRAMWKWCVKLGVFPTAQRMCAPISTMSAPIAQWVHLSVQWVHL